MLWKNGAPKIPVPQKVRQKVHNLRSLTDIDSHDALRSHEISLLEESGRAQQQLFRELEHRVWRAQRDPSVWISFFFLKIGSVIWIKPNRLCFPYAHKSHKGSCFVVFEIQCFSYTFHHLFLRQFAYPFVKKGAKPPKKRTFLHVEGLNLHRVTCWGRTSQAGWGRQSPPELCWAWGMDVEPLSRVERGGFRFFSTDVSQGVVRVSMVLCFMVQQEKSPRFSLSDVHGKAQLMKELEEFCTQKFIQAGFFAWIFSHTVCRVCRMYLCQSWKQFWASAFSGDPPGLGIFWDLSPCSGTGSSRKRIGRS